MDRWPLQLRVAATASLILLFGLFGLMAVQQKTERDGLLAHAQHREQEGADRTADIINQRIAGIQRALQLVSEGDRKSVV